VGSIGIARTLYPLISCRTQSVPVVNQQAWYLSPKVAMVRYTRNARGPTLADVLLNANLHQNRYGRVQKEKISSFRSVTGASDKQSIECLKSMNWAVEPAIDYFYNSGMSATAGGVDPRAVEALFDRYKGGHQNAPACSLAIGPDLNFSATSRCGRKHHQGQRR
jgi:hypothetical protein